MSSAVEAISCSKVDVPAGPEPEEAAKKAAAPNGKCGEAAPRCHEEDDEEDAPKVIDLGPRVSIKEQLEKDKVRTPSRSLPCILPSQPPLLPSFVPVCMSTILSVSFGYQEPLQFKCVSSLTIMLVGGCVSLAGRREPAAMEGAAPRQRGLQLRGR
jgi:hypothetical protein